MTASKHINVNNKGEICRASWEGGSCNRPAFARLLCNSHYLQKKRGKLFTELSPMYFRPPIHDEFELCEWYFRNRINIIGDCWIWTGKTSRDYPAMRFAGEHHRVYRFVAQWINNAGQSLPLGATVHHTCANPKCINPQHLQIIDAISNQAEMLERRAYRKRIAQLEARLLHCKCPTEPLVDPETNSTNLRLLEEQFEFQRRHGE